MTQLPAQNVSDYEKYLQKKMNLFFNGNESKFSEFKKVLIECGGLISGSSVLCSIIPDSLKRKSDWESMDLDIYVNIKHVQKMLNFLKIDANNGTKYYTVCDHVRSKTSYCDSFLVRNKIQKVHKIYLKDHGIDNPIMNIDVMAVRNSQPVINVVNNFDLTFCQVWYTGEHIFTSHPDHILQRKGILQGDYTKTFMEGNTFLARRLTKYRRRGFEIHLDPSFITTGVLPAIKKDPEMYIKYFDSGDKKLKLITKNIFHRITLLLCNMNNDGYDSEEYDSIDKLRKFTQSQDAVQEFKNAGHEFRWPKEMMVEEAISIYYRDMYNASFNSPLGQIHFEWIKNYISFVSLTGDINSRYILDNLDDMGLPNPTNPTTSTPIMKRQRSDMEDSDDELSFPDSKRPRKS